MDVNPLTHGLSIVDINTMYDMAGAMLQLGKQHLGDAGLAEFVADYPDLAEPEHLRERAWAPIVDYVASETDEIFEGRRPELSELLAHALDAMRQQQEDAK